MNLLAVICAALSLDPIDATRLACRLERYEPCGEVLRLVAVESRGVAVGVHTRHARRVLGGVFWRRAVAAGLLHPERCSRLVRARESRDPCDIIVLLASLAWVIDDLISPVEDDGVNPRSWKPGRVGLSKGCGRPVHVRRRRAVSDRAGVRPRWAHAGVLSSLAACPPARPQTTRTS